MIGCTADKTKVVKDTSIVFLSNREAPKRQFHIFTMKSDGSEPVNLTKTVKGITSISNPVFSPDGRKILYVSFGRDKKILRLMNRDGSNITDLTETNIDVPNPIFSPDGSKILYTTKIGRNKKPIRKRKWQRYIDKSC